MSDIYLDTNATAPLASEVAAAMAPWWEHRPANPSAVHRHGQRARAAVERAREQVAELFGDGSQVVFTSGGTEADNQALWGAVGWPPAGHLVTTSVEHPAVLAPARALGDLGVEVTLLPVDADGSVDPTAVAAALRPETRLVSVMTANNEIGTIQPVAEIVARAHDAGVPVHTDAVQALAWIDIPSAVGDADYVSISAHKIAGPAGIGALVLRNGRDVPAWVRGGGQQSGRRAGTEPTALIVGFGAACARVARERDAQAHRVAVLRDRLLDEIRARVPDVHPTVSRRRCLPNTLHLCFPHTDAGALVARLDLDGVAVSAGAACGSGVRKQGSVLEAIGLPPELRGGAVRLSLGYHSSADEVVRAAAILATAVEAVRAAVELP